MSNDPQPAVSPSLVDEFARQWGLDPAIVLSAPRRDPEEASRRAIAAARAQDRLARFHADIGEEYRETDWSHPNLAPFAAISFRVTAWQPNKRGLLLCGPSGRGKTRAISALYHRLAIEEGHEVRYFNAADWFSELGRQIRYGVDDARTFVNRHARYPIFILDDLGQEAKMRSTEDWAESWLFRFLDIRRAEGLPLITSTNLTANEIAGIEPTTDRAKANGERKKLRSDPLLVRLLDLCEVVRYETGSERSARSG